MVGGGCLGQFQTQKRAGFPALFQKSTAASLALGELEGLAGLGLAVLLAFHDAAVTGEKTTLLEDRTQGRLKEVERLGDAVANGTGLTAETAAGNRDDNVVLVGAFGRHDRLLDDQLQHWTGKIGCKLTAIDRDLALAGLDPDAGNRVLALAGCIGTALRVELLQVHRGGVDSSSGDGGGAEVFEGVDGFGHITSPAHSWSSSQRHPASPGSALRGDAQRPCRRGDS
eukprot:GHVR01039774.1.p1 GENE.GHVR01039774.1~~GHVR01039774.1.p1  ORF type:complete len:227 (+),score=37.06 GHVR01039774.1:130-810(+)